MNGIAMVPPKPRPGAAGGQKEIGSSDSPAQPDAPAPDPASEHARSERATRLARALNWIACIIAALVIGTWLWWRSDDGSSISYLCALHMESRWGRALPSTKRDLERHLYLYTQSVVPQSKSGWAGNHRLKPGERIVEYLLLYRAPLHVVYDSADNLVAIYTSYE